MSLLSNYETDQSAAIFATLREHQEGNDLIARLLKNVREDTPESLIAGASAVFDDRGYERRRNFPPEGGPYDTPEAADLQVVSSSVTEHLTGSHVFPWEQVDPEFSSGHAAAQILSISTNRRKSGQRIYTNVRTYVFGVGGGEVVAFSEVNESLPGELRRRLVQGFAPPEFYQDLPGVHLLLPEHVRRERPASS